MISEKKRKFTILLVEDNPGDVRLLEEAFKESLIKTQINTVQDGQSAIEYLKKRGKFGNTAVRPDIILLDLNLPKKDGKEVLLEIKSDEVLKSIPVIILTTSNSDDDILRSYMLHANCYITKPVDFNDFMQTIRELENFWFRIVKLPEN